MSLMSGTFLISCAALILEISLSRLLSVITWYHLAFFAVSTAMLGMTAGALSVFNEKSPPPGESRQILAGRASLAFAVNVPIALIILCINRLCLVDSLGTFLAYIPATAACALPFYYSGRALTAVLSSGELAIGKLYACDLAGAALGCLAALVGLQLFDTPSLILLSGALGSIAAYFYLGPAENPHHLRWQAGALALFLALAGLVNTHPMGFRPFWVKGRWNPPGTYLLDRWNSHSRIMVQPPKKGPPIYWGPSPLAPVNDITQVALDIDGEAGTFVQKFSTKEDIRHLQFDLTNIGYYLRPQGNACVIGVGGGRDLQAALLFGHSSVVGVEVNPIFIDLLKTEFRELAGLANRPEVTLVVDEARSWLSRNHQQFSLIMMSLIDTWASTGAGACSLTESALYTVEAWNTFFDRLAPNGIFTVSRWFNPADLDETGRLVSLGVASLLKRGITDPSRHLSMITCRNLSTLLVSLQPFSDEDIQKLEETAASLRFQIAICPGKPVEHPNLRSISSAKSLEELDRVTSGQLLRQDAPTDENPYFFQMARLSSLLKLGNSYPGIIRGNIYATLTLSTLVVILFFSAIGVLLVPLLRTTDLSRVDRRTFWSGALYFSLIGAGFMAAEIGLIQRLSVFLGHPTYALSVLLFTIIAGTGLGSRLSEWFVNSPDVGRPTGLSGLLRNWRSLNGPVRFGLPLVAVASLVFVRFYLPPLITANIVEPSWWRIFLTITCLFPLGTILGFFFPLGMRLIPISASEAKPWYLALNGIFSVLFSALAVLIAIFKGISVNFDIAALCYLLTLVPLKMLGQPDKEQ